MITNLLYFIYTIIDMKLELNIEFEHFLKYFKK